MNDAIRLSYGHSFFQAAKFSQHFLTASIAMVIASQQVSAQPSMPAKNASGFEEVVVTAQRRSELAVDVPISITSLDADQLVNSDIQQLGDIMKLTPALRFDQTGGFSQATIRGVGTAVVVAGGGSNVAIYTDGFYSPNPLMADSELLSVTNVQVLKGPQGTLFGRNATGGAILVTTKEPSSAESIDLQASYGSYNTQGYQLYATGGPSDTLAFDVAGSYNSSDGFLDNIATGSDSDGEYNNSTIRLGVKWEATDKVSALLRYTHGGIDDASPVNVNAYKKDGYVYSTAALLGSNVATKSDEVSNGYQPSFTSRTDTEQLTVKVDLDFALLTSYTQYRDETGTHHHDFDASELNIFHYKYDTTDKVFTQEFLLASTGDNRLQWTTGLFYFTDKTAFENNKQARGIPPDYVAQVPFAFSGGSGVKDSSIAAYGDATYTLMDNLYLTAGLRYSQDKITDAYFDDPTTLDKVNVPDLDNDQLTPRVALRYELNKSSSVYASYTEGFKSGILNVGGATLTDIKIKPEEIKAYEVGYKFSSGSMMLDLATYYYDYSNLQVASYTVTPTGAVSVIQNAANSTVYGVDGQIRYAVTEQFEVNFGAAYNHSKYDNFEKSQVWAQCTNSAACGPYYGVFNPSYADASGNEMQHAPEFTGTLGANYRTGLADGSLNLSGTLYHTSDFYFDSSNAYKQDAYNLLSLRAAWTDPSNHYTVALYGDNLTDEEYRTQVLPQFYGTLSTWGMPRTIGVSLGVHY